MTFELHPQLAADTHLIQDSGEVLLLTMNDNQYPWFIVVPKVAQITEWHELDPHMQVHLHLFCVELGRAVKTGFGCSKINIAALGNMVSQLHVHVIGRHPGDPSWPKPVWGQLPPVALTEQELQDRILTIGEHFQPSSTYNN